jgi:hypothetical protein
MPTKKKKKPTSNKKAAYTKQRKDALSGAYDMSKSSASRKKSYDTALKIYSKLPKNKDPQKNPFDRDTIAASDKAELARGAAKNKKKK